jgi:hypothetical protein
LQRLYASLETSRKMTWHSENYEQWKGSGELRNPSDGLVWKHFDQVNPDFASEPRNVRLGLCSDGFTPYTQVSATSYSCWPVIVTSYNLPPEIHLEDGQDVMMRIYQIGMTIINFNYNYF